MKIGDKIRKIRELKGISQEYIASQLNITPQAFGKIEREETKLDFGRVEQIAKVLQIDPLDIVNFDESKIFNNTFNNHAPHNNNFILNENSKLEKIIELLHLEVNQLRKSNELLFQFFEKENQK